MYHQQKLHVTLELNAQMQKDLSEKEEKIRILEAKNETLRQTADAKTDEIENLKQKIMMLEQQVALYHRKIVYMQTFCYTAIKQSR